MLLLPLTFLYALGLSQLIAFDQPGLDIGSLGRIGFTGHFDSIEVQKYPGQNHGYNPAEGKPSAVLEQLPGGLFEAVAQSDENLNALTSFVLSDGTVAGVVVAGNFTYIGDTYATAVALYNPTTYKVTPLPGLSGNVRALLCVSETNTVYVGGNFEGANSTNALAWIGTTGWANLPFAGFNGAVNAIAQAPSGNILFGGAFTYLGDAPNCTTPQQKNSSKCSIETGGQLIPLSPPPALNGLFEYNPNLAIVSSDFVTHSGFVDAGLALDAAAQVNCLLVSGDSIYVAGNFTSNAFNNIFEISNIDSDSNQTNGLGGGGLDNQVRALLLEGNMMYVGGDFRATRDTGAQSVKGLNYVAAWDIIKRAWMPLGGGVNGPVQTLNVLQLNITGKPEVIIIVNGDFDTLLPLKGFGALAANGVGVWVPSRNQWLPNLDVPQPSFAGTLVQTLRLPNGPLLGIGEFQSDGLRAGGAAVMDYGPGDVSFQSLGTPAGIVDQEGPLTGLFYTDDGLNMTIIAGQFTADLSDGTTAPNLLLLNTTANGTQYATSFKLMMAPVYETEEAKVTALETSNTTLYVGGAFSSEINGQQLRSLVLCNLKANDFVSPQPPTLQGANVVVTSIITRPFHQDVYVGGSFHGAGELVCEGVCVWSMTQHKWSTPGTGLRGTVKSMIFTDENSLVVSGNLSIGGIEVSLASYYAPLQQWTPYIRNEQLPGMITAMIPANSAASTSAWSSDSTAFWVTGLCPNGSWFLMKWSGSNWLTVWNAFESSTQITGLEVITTRKPHNITQYLDHNQALLLLGMIDLPNYGNVSAALFNGTDFLPFIVTFNTTTGEVGRISSIFSDGQFYSAGAAVDDKGNVVAIGVSVIGALLAIVFIGEIQGRLANRIAARNDRRKYPPIVDSREKRRIHKILLATQRRGADNKS